MEHTFLFETRNWLAEGHYYDENGNRFNLTGNSNIVYTEDQWTIKGFMEVMFENPIKFYNDYDIKSSNDKHHTIPWESYNPAFGKLIGNMVIDGNIITSRYISEDGKCTGHETLKQVDKYTYENIGECHLDGKKISSWSAILRANIGI